MKRIYTLLSVLTAAFIIATTARADVKLPALISSGMVLQQGMSVPLVGLGR